jgi:hypothetical protein
LRGGSRRDILLGEGFLKIDRRKHDSRDRWFAVYHSSATDPGSQIIAQPRYQS